MKKFISIIFVAIISFGLGRFAFDSQLKSVGAAADDTASGEYKTPTKILYCQKERCDREVVNQILAAHSFVYFAMYTITRQSIVDALIGAKMRGLDVRGVLDFNQSLIAEEKPELSQLKKAGVEMESPFMADGGLMHMKLLVTDNAYVSGSFNWTNAATLYNDEVIESGSAPSIRSQYQSVFETLWKQYNSSKI
jgi:phosphatidylserine/phosphatidylglycerophosphate/cardiolipin synthase-like enzyme